MNRGVSAPSDLKAYPLTELKLCSQAGLSRAFIVCHSGWPLVVRELAVFLPVRRMQG